MLAFGVDDVRSLDPVEDKVRDGDDVGEGLLLLSVEVLESLFKQSERDRWEMDSLVRKSGATPSLGTRVSRHKTKPK